MGIFWPRATEFMASMAEIPVDIISSGYTCRKSAMYSKREREWTYSSVRIDGTAVDVKIVLSQHFGTFVDSSS